MASQAGRFPLSQGQHYFPGSQHSPQENLVVSQSGRQAGAHFPGDSTASQVASTVSRGGNSFSSFPGRYSGRFLSQGWHCFPGIQCNLPGKFVVS